MNDQRYSWNKRSHDLVHIELHDEMSVLFYQINLQKRLWTWENNDKLAALAQLKPLAGIDDVHLGLLSCLPFDIVLMVVDYDRRKMRFLKVQRQMATAKKMMNGYPGMFMEIMMPPVGKTKRSDLGYQFLDGLDETAVVYRGVGCQVTQDRLNFMQRNVYWREKICQEPFSAAPCVFTVMHMIAFNNFRPNHRLTVDFKKL